MESLHDMHCHLGFASDGEGEKIAAGALAAGTRLFANSVTPADWLTTRERFADFPNVTVGFGMHPWWVENASEAQEDNPERTRSQRAEHRRIAEAADRQSEDPAAVQRTAALRRQVITSLDQHKPVHLGEVGLDFGWRHVPTRRAQEAVFADITRWAALQGDRILSLHAIRSCKEVLDILEQMGALANCSCIFHWFSGSGDQLKRAIAADCFFSCGPRMLATGKGREYLKAIPANRLLLETDLPSTPGESCSYTQLHTNLEQVAAHIAAVKGESALETIAQTSATLLDGRR
jgi:TatD DNase family protein